ncbi:MAG: hypothetical protein QXQ88_01430 [archaeon]
MVLKTKNILDFKDALFGILEVTGGPYPKSAKEITVHLKNKYPDLYKFTRIEKASGFIRKKYLEPFVELNFIYKYTPEDSCWPKAKGLINHFYRKYGGTPPRKLICTYLSNFFCTKDIFFTIKINKEINLDLHALFPNKNHPDFLPEFLNLLSLFKKSKDLAMVHLESMDAQDIRKQALARVLENTAREIDLPFEPNKERAKKFLDFLVNNSGGSI